MTDLLAARSLMAVSLGFHILFAIAGMALPLLMALAQWRWLTTADPGYKELARRWAKGTAILFAVGAVSGTVLSFELGLLWPEFMRNAGPLVGMPFSLEGFAFFLEAIFLGLYLYGWEKLSPRVHLACGFGVALCGLASAVFVTAVNAWMNQPLAYGDPSPVDPLIAFRSASFPTQAIHMALAAYASVSLAAAGIHAWGLRSSPHSTFHARAFRLCLAVALVTVPLQLLSGDMSAKNVAEYQPLKLAAAESLFETQTGAPLAILGWPNVAEHKLQGAIEIPLALSVLATGSPSGTVQGLLEAPRELWPPVGVVHTAFQVMVLSGLVMFLFVAWGGWLWRRGQPPPWEHPLYLRLSPWIAPLGLLAIEAGWVVTEVGRQPWIVWGVLRTRDALTPVSGLSVHFFCFSGLYLLLGIVVIVMLRRHVLLTAHST
jgi:cytochrome bd ubiquinol oxidase subunit I